MATTGKIVQVIGSTLDAEFPESDLPATFQRFFSSGNSSSAYSVPALASPRGSAKRAPRPSHRPCSE